MVHVGCMKLKNENRKEDKWRSEETRRKSCVGMH